MHTTIHRKVFTAAVHMSMDSSRAQMYTLRVKHPRKQQFLVLTHNHQPPHPLRLRETQQPAQSHVALHAGAEAGCPGILGSCDWPSRAERFTELRTRTFVSLCKHYFRNASMLSERRAPLHEGGAQDTGLDMDPEADAVLERRALCGEGASQSAAPSTLPA